MRHRWEGWTVKIESSGPIGELPPQTMIEDNPKPLEASGGARGINYFRADPGPDPDPHYLILDRVTRHYVGHV